MVVEELTGLLLTLQKKREGWKGRMVSTGMKAAWIRFDFGFAAEYII